MARPAAALQFFDRQGDAVHKVYLDNEQHVARLIAGGGLRPDQQVALNLEPGPATAATQQATPPVPRRSANCASRGRS
jgi:putative hemin transport protein